jgi:hypothetical protein
MRDTIGIVEVITENNTDPVDDAAMTSLGVRDISGGGEMDLEVENESIFADV